MEPKEFFILAMKILALFSLTGAGLVEFFASEENRKHERMISLLLFSIAQSLLVVWLQ